MRELDKALFAYDKYGPAICRAAGEVSKGGTGKTLYIKLSVYPCGKANPTRNLTISCSDKSTRFKTTLTDNGLRAFREYVLKFYEGLVLDRRV